MASDEEVESVESAATTSSADLVVSQLSDPPATLARDEVFVVTSEVTNAGTVAALRSSSTAYYLSTTATAPFKLAIRFQSSTTVAALAAATKATEQASLVIPSSVDPVATGAYFLVACADYGNAIAETSEANNCRAARRAVIVRGSDLVPEQLSHPPASALLGEPIVIEHAIANRGDLATAPSDTAFYLSSTNAAPFKYRLRYSSAQPVPALAPGATYTAAATLVAPAGIEEGSFYLVACADYGGAVRELSEKNNCRVSPQPIALRGPDLVVTQPSVSPTRIAANGALTFRETIANVDESAPAPASRTAYRFSRDATLDANDDVLVSCTDGTSAVWREVPAIAALGSDTNATTVTALCLEDRDNAERPIGPGTYHVFFCADGMRQAHETHEANNCTLAPEPVVVDAVPSPAAIVALAISPKVGQVARGTSQRFTAVAVYSDFSVRVVTPTWTSSTPTVATIDASGTAKSGAAGTTTIAATYASVGDTAVLAATTATIQSLAVMPESATSTPTTFLMAWTTSQQFKAIATMTDGTVQDVSSDAAWSSSASLLLGVSSTGVASALLSITSSVQIRATVLGTTRSCNIDLEAGLPTALRIEGVADAPAGVTTSLRAIGTFPRLVGTYEQDITQLVTWTSSSPAVATVAAGQATAVGSGTTTITARYAPALAIPVEATRTFTASTATPVRITVAQASALVEFSDGTTRELAAQASWTSSAPEVASVDQTGRVRMLGGGTAVIRARFGTVVGARIVSQ